MIPEKDETSRKIDRIDGWWTGYVALCTAVGLVFVEIADVASRRAYGDIRTSVLFWFGLLLIVVPIAGRVLMQGTNRRERLALIVLLGVALYLVKVLGSPYAFTYVDEYIHVRTTQNILRTHHLFGVNPLLPTAAYYPGLGALTSGLVDLTGLSIFTSGLIIIGVARILISVCIFLVAEKVTGSSRSAVLASLIYACNPLFLFWSASFSYENLALPLATFVVWWIGRTRQKSGAAPLAAAIVVIIAIAITHHVVGFALTGLLSAWWIVERFTLGPSSARGRVGLMALVTGAASLVWFFVVARPAASYLLSNSLFPALRQTGSLLDGHTSPRRLYVSGGYTSPTWQTVAGFAAIGILLLALPPALYRAWRRRDHVSVAIAIGVAVLFPLSLVPRLAPNGVALSARSWEYIFVGLGCVLGLLARDAALPRHRRDRKHLRFRALVGWRRTALVTCLVTLVFIGDVTIGTPFYQLLPESSHPQGYPWSVQPDVVRASHWAQARLGINQMFGANAIDSLALATDGEQDTVAENQVWPIFFSDTMNHSVVNRIKAERLHYILVDWRMTKGVPPTPGFYFSTQEPGAASYKNAFPIADLQKFGDDKCSNSVYRSASIEIFDVSRIANGSCVPRQSSAAKNHRTL